jgi:O-antigen ligase
MISVMGFCLMSLLPLTLFTLLLRGEERDYAVITRGAGVIGAGLAVWALVQYYALNEMFDGKAHHPLANPGSLAALFNLMLIPALGWMVNASAQRDRIFALILSILLFAGVTATGSRGAFFCAIGAAILFFILVRGQAMAKRGSVVLFAIGCAVMTVLTSIGTMNHENLVTRLGQFEAEAQRVGWGNNRADIWTGTMEMIADHWALGTGIGSFFLHYPTYRHESDSVGAHLAHNDPLQLWAEAGILAPILFYALAILILIRGVRAAKAITQRGGSTVMLWAVFCALMTMFVHAHVNFNFYVPCLLLLTGAMLAWWVKATQEALGKGAVTLRFPGFIPQQYRNGVFILPLVMMAALFSCFMVSEILIDRAKRAIAREDLERFIETVNLADAAALRMNFNPYLLAVSVPIGAVETNGKDMTLEEHHAVFAQVKGYMDAAERINPLNAAVPYYRGYVQKFLRAEAVPEGTPTPEEYYREALSRNPLHIASRLEMMELYRAAGDVESFRPLVEEGLRWTYNSPLALRFYEEVMQFYVFTGDLSAFNKVKDMRQSMTYRLERARESGAMVPGIGRLE